MRNVSQSAESVNGCSGGDWSPEVRSLLIRACETMRADREIVRWQCDYLTKVLLDPRMTPEHFFILAAVAFKSKRPGQKIAVDLDLIAIHVPAAQNRLFVASARSLLGAVQ